MQLKFFRILTEASFVKTWGIQFHHPYDLFPSSERPVCRPSGACSYLLIKEKILPCLFLKCVRLMLARNAKNSTILLCEQDLNKAPGFATTVPLSGSLNFAVVTLMQLVYFIVVSLGCRVCRLHWKVFSKIIALKLLIENCVTSVTEMVLTTSWISVVFFDSIIIPLGLGTCLDMWCKWGGRRENGTGVVWQLLCQTEDFFLSWPL